MHQASANRFQVQSAEELGSLLRGLRRARRLTQAQLATRASLLPKTISALESGSGHVLVSTLMRCISALEVEMTIAPRGPSEPTARAGKIVAKKTAKALKERW